jgi:hypothetical protein
MRYRQKLTPQERTEVLAVLSVGCSRLTAAHCALYRLRQEMSRDPQFAAQVVKAEAGLELFCLTRIRSAASKEQHWRAAAWLLERRLPHRYAIRKPESLATEHVQNFIETCLRIITEELPDKQQREKLLDRISEELEAAET